jgi:hypothetical protein
MPLIPAITRKMTRMKDPRRRERLSSLTFYPLSSSPSQTGKFSLQPLRPFIFHMSLESHADLGLVQLHRFSERQGPSDTTDN